MSTELPASRLREDRDTAFAASTPSYGKSRTDGASRLRETRHSTNATPDVFTNAVGADGTLAVDWRDEHDK